VAGRTISLLLLLLTTTGSGSGAAVPVEAVTGALLLFCAADALTEGGVVCFVSVGDSSSTGTALGAVRESFETDAATSGCVEMTCSGCAEITCCGWVEMTCGG